MITLRARIDREARPVVRRLVEMGGYFGRAGIAVAALTLVSGAAAAQSRLPGLVVTTPENGPAQPQAQPNGSAPTSRDGNRTTRPAERRNTRTNRSNNRSGGGRGRGRLAIVLLVNDDPITNFEIEERARLLATSANVRDQARRNFQALVKNPKTNERLKAILQETIAQNQGRSREQVIAAFEKRKQAYGRQLQERAMSSARSAAVSRMKQKARDELIEERLKLQEAKRLGMTPSEDRVNDIFKQIAQRNKLTPEQFTKNLRRSGASANSMKARFRAQIAWNMVINARFRRLVSVSQRDIDQFIDQSSEGDGVQMRLQRIVLAVPDNLNQQAVAARLSEADGLRRQFRGCQSTSALVRSVANARSEDMGQTDPNKLPEPTRSMLLSADENDILPPSLGSKGIEMYAVCSKSTSQGSLEARNEASRKLESRELEMLGRRHLADLKRDAHIERR